MAKRTRRRPTKKGQKKTLTSAQSIIRKAQMSSLDRLGMAYARLLQDPCGAPLAYPVYGTQDGTLLVKAEQTYITPALGSAGMFAWTPGALLSSSSNASAFWAGASSADVAVNTATGTGTGYVNVDLATTQPGYTFLTTQTAAFRCVAACVEVVWTGAESTRQGMIAGGVVSGDTVIQTTLSPSQLTNTVNWSERTPVSKTEFIWYPGAYDSQFAEAESSSGNNSGRNALALAFLNCADKFRLKLTAIYEYKPKATSGVAVAPPGPSSRNTLNDVYRFISSLSANPWVRSAAMNAGAQFVQAIQYYNNRRPFITYRDSANEL